MMIVPFAGCESPAEFPWRSITTSRASPPGDGACVYLSEEDTPEIHRFDLATGRRLDTLPLPEIYKHIMINQGLESLTRFPNGATLWTANERALIPDGNLKNIAVTGCAGAVAGCTISGRIMSCSSCDRMWQCHT